MLNRRTQQHWVLLGRWGWQQGHCCWALVAACFNFSGSGSQEHWVYLKRKTPELGVRPFSQTQRSWVWHCSQTQALLQTPNPSMVGQARLQDLRDLNPRSCLSQATSIMCPFRAPSFSSLEGDAKPKLIIIIIIFNFNIQIKSMVIFQY